MMDVGILKVSIVFPHLLTIEDKNPEALSAFLKLAQTLHAKGGLQGWLTFQS